MTLSPVILNMIPKVLCHQPQEEVPGAQKAYLLCAMERSIYTAQSFQNWLNLPNINKPYISLAIKWQMGLNINCKYYCIITLVHIYILLYSVEWDTLINYILQQTCVVRYGLYCLALQCVFLDSRK